MRKNSVVRLLYTVFISYDLCLCVCNAHCVYICNGILICVKNSYYISYPCMHMRKTEG